MAAVPGEGATTIYTAGQHESNAEKRLLRQFAKAQLQLKEQERTTKRALFDRQILEDKIRFLELELVHKEHSLVAAQRARDVEIKDISSALDETRARVGEAKIAIDKLLKERATNIMATSSYPTFSRPIAQAALDSGRPYVCVIIDGDANHFRPELLRAGWSGGELAAARFKEEISKFIGQRRHIPQNCLIKVQIFMNRSGYVDTVNRADQTPKLIINYCLDRFFQTQPTWDLVDTGGLRESADTKIKGIWSTANFNFFVHDSDCFAMIMGTCSDNGYVQLLQEFQGDSELMTKIVLLTSCNTVLSMQSLTYAIVQWPTVFRSQEINSKTRSGLARPHTKRFTPLEDRVLIASRSSVAANIGKRLTASSKPYFPQGHPAHIPSMQSDVTSIPDSLLVNSVRDPSKATQSEMPHEEQQRSNSTIDGRHMTSPRSDCQEGDCLGTTDIIVSPAEGRERKQSEGESSENPGGELVRVFDTSKTLVRRHVKLVYSTGSLTLLVKEVLTPTGCMMGIVAFSLVGNPSLRSTMPSRAEGTQSDPPTPSRAIEAIATVSTSDKPLVRKQAEREVIDSTFRTPSAFGPAQSVARSSPRQSLIHIPIRNRAEEQAYSPDRFLYQQSPQYLTYIRRFFQHLISDARQTHNTSLSAQRPQLTRELEFADFMIARLWLAQAIQHLEDQAIERQISCSRPSTFRCGDAWTNDWYLYCSMCDAMGVGVNPVLKQLSNGYAGSSGRIRGLASTDWVELVEKSTDLDGGWVEECYTEKWEEEVEIGREDTVAG